MIGFSRSSLPDKTGGVFNGDDDYTAEYSIGLEYTGPPVSFDIPRIAPVDMRRVPTAVVPAVSLTSSSLPIVHPIVSKGLRVKKQQFPDKFKPYLDASPSQVLPLGSGDSEKLFNSVDPENPCQREADPSSENPIMITEKDRDQTDISDDSVPDVGESSKSTSSHSNVVEEENMVETRRQGHRSFVTFQGLDSSDSISDRSCRGEPEMSPERPVVQLDGRKGTCHKCGKRNRFSEREVCIVCGAKYCINCVLRGMGSMPEGRKCITCIGHPINESKRQSLGKCSKILTKLLTHEVIQQVMDAERSCEANRPPPHRIVVNGKPLCLQELVALQSCCNPPKKLKPGRYWYDKVCGFWGKEGEKPCQIISAELAVGDPLQEDASNGNTNVKINNREITKQELRMLKAAGIHCEGNPHFWVGDDGSCMHEGMNNVVGMLWDKKRMRIFCAILSLPYPSNDKKARGPVAERVSDADNGNHEDQKPLNKLLLLGDDQSGTSTIFKQARILYDVPFTDEEKQDLKTIIQRNLYRYMALLLDGRGLLEKECERSASEPGPSGSKAPFHAFPPRLEAFASELTEMLSSGSLEVIFPAATREYSPLVKELWNDKSFQAIYRRQSEIETLPIVAGYFLDKAIEISRVDYEPSEMDILYAEGISSCNGVACVNFILPTTTEEAFMESDLNDPPASYQLIRASTSSLGEKCKFLQLFEGMDLVIFCASLTNYDEYYEDQDGVRKNKMLATKKLFETVVTHPILSESNFILILNKYDLLEKKIKQVPLQECVWFQDFCPVISLHPENTNGTNTSLGQKAFHYIAVKFKRLFTSLTGRKLFVSRVTGLDSGTVDNAIRLCKEIMKWDDAEHPISTNEWSSESAEQSHSTSIE